MRDHLVRGVVEGRGLRAVYTRVTETARIARLLHGLYPTSAHLFAEGLAAGVLLGSLQKAENGRVNLQLECDGPVRGFFVDADVEGNVRGYVRRPEVHFPGDAERGARAALGRTGYLSVLRDLGEGRFYRGAVELRDLSIAGDLHRFFEESEQTPTALALHVVPRGDEPLGDVAGLLVQRLPDGDPETLGDVEVRLARGALREALERGASAQETLDDVLGGGFDLLADLEVSYRCTCSALRARAAVSALGIEGIEDVLANEKEAVITCEFCRRRYVVTEPELRDMARRLAERDRSGA